MNNNKEIKCEIKFYENENNYYIEFEKGNIVLNYENEIIGFDFEEKDFGFIYKLGIKLDIYERIENIIKIEIKDLIKEYMNYFN